MGLCLCVCVCACVCVSVRLCDNMRLCLPVNHHLLSSRCNIKNRLCPSRLSHTTAPPITHLLWDITYTYNQLIIFKYYVFIFVYTKCNYVCLDNVNVCLCMHAYEAC